MPSTRPWDKLWCSLGQLYILSCWHCRGFKRKSMTAKQLKLRAYIKPKSESWHVSPGMAWWGWTSAPASEPHAGESRVREAKQMRTIEPSLHAVPALSLEPAGKQKDIVYKLKMFSLKNIILILQLVNKSVKATTRTVSYLILLIWQDNLKKLLFQI